MLLIAFLAALLALLLVNKRFELIIRAGFSGVSGSAAPLLLGLPVLRVRFRFGFDKGVGPFIRFGSGRPRRLKRRGKRDKPRPDPLAFIKVGSLAVSGRLGLEGSPDKSVILTGLVVQLLSLLAAFLSPDEIDLNVKPELQKTAFDLNVEGILVFSPGRLIIEILNSKRRKP